MTVDEQVQNYLKRAEEIQSKCGFISANQMVEIAKMIQLEEHKIQPVISAPGGSGSIQCVSDDCRKGACGGSFGNGGGGKRGNGGDGKRGNGGDGKRGNN